MSKLLCNLWCNHAKFRASMEPFWDLNFSEYVACIQRSSMLPSLMSSNGRILCVLLADVILWIYIDSPVLYIARTMCNVPPNQSEAILCYQVFLCNWSFETCHYRGQEPLPMIWVQSATEAAASIHDVDCAPTIMTTFTTYTTSTMQLLRTWSSFHNIHIIIL